MTAPIAIRPTITGQLVDLMPGKLWDLFRHALVGIAIIFAGMIGPNFLDGRGGKPDGSHEKIQM